MPNITLSIVSLFLSGVNVAVNKWISISMRCRNALLWYILRPLQQFFESEKLLNEKLLIMVELFMPFTYLSFVGNFFFYLFRSTFSDHSIPGLFISFSRLFISFWTMCKWSMKFQCKFFIRVIFDSADCNLIVFILLLTF